MACQPSLIGPSGCPGAVASSTRDVASRPITARPSISEQAIRRLREYGRPGNVRELQNLMERAAVLCPGDVVDVAELPAELTGPQARHDLGESALRDDGDDLALPHHVEALERTLIDRALRRAHGNKAAARALETSERSLWYRIKKYGL